MSIKINFLPTLFFTIELPRVEKKNNKKNLQLKVTKIRFTSFFRFVLKKNLKPNVHSVFLLPQFLYGISDATKLLPEIINRKMQTKKMSSYRHEDIFTIIRNFNDLFSFEIRFLFTNFLILWPLAK